MEKEQNTYKNKEEEIFNSNSFSIKIKLKIEKEKKKKIVSKHTYKIHTISGKEEEKLKFLEFTYNDDRSCFGDDVVKMMTIFITLSY